MKDELGGKTMEEFLGLKTKTYSYLIDGSIVTVKKQKVQEKLCHKKKNLNLKIIKIV